ncbi:hypothetical protein KGV55_02155 [Candidatus Gracilibacteria bacterium]|nr:hypothetical protein [Candidatus Gracilibacteria bacterium]
MIQLIPISHNFQEDTYHVRSHVLSPEQDISVILTLRGKQENILSILEDHLLETTSATAWEDAKEDGDFTYITEHYNQHIKSLEDTDLQDVDILLAVIKDTILTVSTVGDAGAFLVDNTITTQITSENTSRYEFSMLTNGEITKGSSIFLASQNIQELLGNELLQELSVLEKDAFNSVITTLLKREVEQSIHLVRIRHPQKVANRLGKKEVDNYMNIARNTGKKWIHSLKQHRIWKYSQEKMRNMINLEDKRQQYVFLGIGMVILFLLVYMLLIGIGNYITGVPAQVQTQIQQAKNLVEESSGLTNNQESFEEKINQAEDLIFELKKQNIKTKEIQNLETRIDILKKETYDIQTVDLTQASSLFSIEGIIDPIGVIEKDNKLTLIGKRKLIPDVVRDSNFPEAIEYPQGNEAQYFSSNEAGKIYITTNSHHVLSPSGKSINYINAMGGKGWDFLGPIDTYGSNLYFVGNKEDQIIKYVPGQNLTFSKKTDYLPKKLNDILDIGIDGGFYLLMKNGQINRYYSASNKGIYPLTLNKIPNTWSINPKESAQIITSDRLSYVYIQNGKRVWIFSPNTKDYKSIKSLDYIAQLEIKTNEKLESITVPRDGLIYATTSKGIFEVGFEVVDGHLTLLR